MQFRSYTYDSTEIDMQYTLDSRGNEIREIQLDESFSGEKEEGDAWKNEWAVSARIHVQEAKSDDAEQKLKGQYYLQN